MGQLRIETKISASPELSLQSFNRSLFLALNPPFPRVQLVQFDGVHLHGITHIVLNFLLFRQTWISKNVESEQSKLALRFVDEGIELPFFLRSWRHEHIIEGTDDGATRIIDSIQFTGRFVPDLFLQPILWLQFVYRKRIYAQIGSGKFVNPVKRERNFD